MKFDHRHYVPCLLWKQGEYQALFRLPRTAKVHITPLIEVPEIGWDFEKAVLAKTLDEHLSPFAKRVRAKWQQRQCFVDLKHIDSSVRMADGSHPLAFVFSNLRTEKCFAVPVTGIDQDAQYQRAVRRAAAEDRNGVCFRVRIVQAAKQDIKTAIDALMKRVNIKPSEVDLVLDLEAPNFVPLVGFCRVVQAIVKRLPYLSKWRTFTILGTSFPHSMGEVKGNAEKLHRYEWLLYKKLVAAFRPEKIRIPAFGDYAICHPDVPRLDMRLVKPAASIRYTIKDAWYILKGPNVRDNGFEQYRGHCQKLVASSHYSGSDFSDGDKYIFDCASGSGSTGNLSKWRAVGTNHHLAKVLQDIASFFGSSSNP